MIERAIPLYTEWTAPDSSALNATARAFIEDITR